MTDWEARYVSGDTPWDEGTPIRLLTDALGAGILGGPGRALVPGGGRGHDASALAAAGWRTTVVDLSPTAAAYATEHYPEVEYVVGDALDASLVHARVGEVDLLWDHTFMCALPPDLRPAVGDVARAVVRPGGIVASGVFPIDRERDGAGPPWAYTPEDMDAVLGDDFERTLTGDPVRLAGAFGWHHRLAVWRRRA